VTCFDWRNFSKLLNGLPFLKCHAVTLKIFQNGLQISWITTCKLSIALWVPPCPLLCTTELIWPDFNYLCVPTTWCHVAHLLPLNNVRCDVNFFLFLCGWHVNNSIFCFTIKVKFYFKKLLKTPQISYTLMKSYYTKEVAPDQSAWLGLRVLCERATWRD
jgi:hypothetical protein